MVLELGELEYPIFLFHRGTWRWHLNLKNTLGTRAHEARVLLSRYPTLKTICYPQQSKTYPTHNRAIHTHKPNLSISLSPSHSASQSRDLPLNLAIIPHKYSHSPSQSRDLPHSPSPSRFRSPSRAVAHGLDLPLTRYVLLLSLHVQHMGIFVCEFVIFMHTLILGFDQFS